MNEPKQPIDRQTNFDWPKRMERDQLIALIAFKRAPFRKRNNVSPPALKGVLNRINRFAVNFEGQKAIGDAIGLTKDQAHRALKLLERYDLIIVERKWNESAKRTLNHYRINWNSLRLIVENQKQESGQTKTTFPENQSDISCLPNPTFSGEQNDISHPTNTTLGTTVIVKELERETTTETEWNVVVVLLEKFSVGNVHDAITKAKARNATPSEVKRLIERVANDASIESGKLAGAIYNQVCRPTPEPSRPKPKLKRPDKERIRTCLFFQLRDSNGIRPCDLDHHSIDAQTEREYQRQLAEYEKQFVEHKHPMETLAATERTR